MTHVAIRVIKKNAWYVWPPQSVGKTFLIYDYHLNIRKIYFWYEIENSKHVIFFSFLHTCDMWNGFVS